MCRLFLALCLVVASPSFVRAESDVRLQFGNSSLLDVLTLYAKTSSRKVWVELGVFGTVTVQSPRDMPIAEGLAFIRTTLLENHGIELRDTATSETFVSWSQDPKYKEVQKTTRLAQPLLPNPDTSRRIRVINPK
jgi:hypothetical protein